MTVMAGSTRERDFTTAVIHLAHLCGWLVHHSRPAITRSGKWATHLQGDPGLPDLVLARNGSVLFFELKVGRNKPGVHQDAWLAALPGAYVFYPHDWDRIRELLDTDGRTKA